MTPRKQTWPIFRTALFILIGLMNTVLIRPEDVGSWKNYAGYAFLVMALVDVVLLVRHFIRTKDAQ